MIKAMTNLTDLTICFYKLFWINLLILFSWDRDSHGPEQIKKRVFRPPVPFFVQRGLTLFPFPSNSSYFLNLFCHLSSLSPAYCLLHTFFKPPPILRANPPILHANHPILRSSHPIQRGNHPRFPPWVRSLPVFQPRATVSGCQGNPLTVGG